MRVGVARSIGRRGEEYRSARGGASVLAGWRRRKFLRISLWLPANGPRERAPGKIRSLALPPDWLPENGPRERAPALPHDRAPGKIQSLALPPDWMARGTPPPDHRLPMAPESGRPHCCATERLGTIRSSEFTTRSDGSVVTGASCTARSNDQGP